MVHPSSVLDKLPMILLPNHLISLSTNTIYLISDYLSTNKHPIVFIRFFFKTNPNYWQLASHIALLLRAWTSRTHPALSRLYDFVLLLAFVALVG